MPTFLFCISVIEEGKAIRKFIKVDFKPEWLPYLISSDVEDGVYKEHEKQVRSAKDEDDRFALGIVERKDLYSWKTYKELEAGKDPESALGSLRKMTGHSERVLTEALRNHKIVQHVVEELKEEIKRQGYNFTEGSPKHKVYGVALLAHSTKIVCHQCVRALVAQQLSRQESTFLQILTKVFNEEGSCFKAYKHTDHKPDGKTRTGIKFATIIVSDRPYDEEEQSKAVREAPSTMILLIGDSLDLKKHDPKAMIELYKPALASGDRVAVAVDSSITVSGSLNAKLLFVERSTGPAEATEAKRALQAFPTHGVLASATTASLASVAAPGGAGVTISILTRKEFEKRFIDVGGAAAATANIDKGLVAGSVIAATASVAVMGGAGDIPIITTKSMLSGKRGAVDLGRS